MRPVRVAGSRTGHGAPISYFNNKAFLLNFNCVASGDAHHDREHSGRNGARKCLSRYRPVCFRNGAAVLNRCSVAKSQPKTARVGQATGRLVDDGVCPCRKQQRHRPRERTQIRQAPSRSANESVRAIARARTGVYTGSCLKLGTDLGTRSFLAGGSSGTPCVTSQLLSQPSCSELGCQSTQRLVRAFRAWPLITRVGAVVLPPRIEPCHSVLEFA